ncbi:lipase family protein [Nocardia arthritidis]|uniref:Lipase n=1 Tax=Nocardia arthritidis TaxID=228602 RepID=A0A6G9Y6A9_9NOCA|nr:lipase family protein [Nocardia arthritidis]QIS08674.1 lipase [Nocardia arthritidis]
MRHSALIRVLAVAALLAFGSISPAHALPYPDDDPFYAAPADIGSYSNGAIVQARRIAMFGLPLPVSAWQVKYRSTDSSERPVAAVTTVLAPLLPWFGPGARPLLSYQIAEDSLGTRCAPSYGLGGGWDLGGINTYIDTPFIATALGRGWAVVTSDYEGPQSRFLDGVDSGRLVLDGIRAARALAPDGVNDASPIGAWGYSGGAFATLWAAQLQPRYAPDVRFAGITSGGVPADWTAIARGVDGTAQAGLAMLVLIATARNDTGNGVLELLNDRGRALVSNESGSCGGDLVAKYVNAHADDFARAPGLFANPVFKAATDIQELGAVAPRAPLYLYHSNSDDVIPVAGYTALVNRYCAAGADIAYRHSPFPGHNPAAVGEAPGAFGYLSDRFAGIPVPAGCRGD